MSPLTNPVNNLLLESLPVRVRNKLLKHCTLVEWKFGDIVCEANQVYEHVYFPITGCIAQLTVVDEHHCLEMGLIGNEGMLGVCLVLGVNNASLQSVVHGSGTALSIPVDQFRRALLNFTDLSILLLRYIYVLMQQLVLAGECLHFHEVEPRLARCLLMIEDRTHGDRLHLTHVLLAKMLGVRRSGVSTAAAVLQKNHLIDYCRGNIRILDRKGLEAASCQCYQAMTESYLRGMR
jgi:CRP-like cAMP-binding protein